MTAVNNPKTIFAVWHSASKGKTSTLREVANQLLQNFPNHISVPGALATVSQTGDFRIVVNINGRIVAVESKGDPNSNLKARLLDLADNFHADLIFCSTRTKGDTTDAVEEHEKTRGFEAIWTSTYQTRRSHTLVNALKGKHIVDLIRSLGIL